MYAELPALTIKWYVITYHLAPWDRLRAWLRWLAGPQFDLSRTRQFSIGRLRGAETGVFWVSLAMIGLEPVGSRPPISQVDVRSVVVSCWRV
jgi:hypothetical protein